MTHVDLELKLASAAPKCANCRHWFCDPTGPRIFGLCQKADRAPTQDLSVCSGWEQAVDPVIEIRKA